MFTGLGLEGFAQRAERELLARASAHANVPPKPATTSPPRRPHIARLVRDGLSNPEIGARLFISPRTAEYHVHKVFSTLGITSRNELERVCRQSRARHWPLGPLVPTLPSVSRIPADRCGRALSRTTLLLHTAGPASSVA